MSMDKNDSLKKAFLEKTDTQPSKGFDEQFFLKLEKEKSRPKSFATWITWAVSGCATASVLFIAITNYNSTHSHAFNHQEYVESVLEVQRDFNEDISTDETIDLTTATTDEI